VIEWVKSGTFDGAASGRFLVNASGLVSPVTTCQQPPQ
jgi:hypothetical protein